MNNKKIFDEVIANSFGFTPSINLDELTEGIINKVTFPIVKSYFDLLRKNNQITKVRPETYFQFINEHSFNAIAFEVENNEFVGLTYGLVLKIYDLVGSLFSNKNFFPEIGKVENENKTIDEIKAQLLYSYSQDNLKWMGSIPNDEVRQQYTIEMSSSVSIFALLHELAHLVKGHLNYPDNKQSHIEFGNLTDSSRLIRLLEYEADSGAIHIMYKLLNHGHHFFSAEKFEDRVFKMWLTINVFIRLLDLEYIEQEINDEFIINQSHPLPSFRLAFLKYEMTLVIGNKSDLIENFMIMDEYINNVLDSIWNDLGFLKCGSFSLSKDFIIRYVQSDIEMLDTYQEKIKKINESRNWNKN